MKIIHLLSQNHLTGAEVYATTLIEQQIQYGHVVLQISNGFFCPTVAECYELSVETKSKFTFIKNVFWLRNLIKTQHIDLVHTHSRAAAKLAYWACFGLKCSVVATIHGQQHSSFSKKLWDQYGDFKIAVCENIKEHLLHDFNYKAERIQVVRNPINTNQFYLSAPKISTIPTAYKSLKVAIVGRTTGPKKQRTQQSLKALDQFQNEQGSRVQIEVDLIGGSVDDFKSESSLKVQELHYIQLSSSIYSQYDLVIGSGRVCIESILTGVSTIAYGEAEYIGLINEKNWGHALKSNFGDINLTSINNSLSQHLFKDHLLTVLTKKNQLFSLKHQEIEVYNQEKKYLSELALQEFALPLVFKKIQRIYESALFIKKHPHWIPVLMYHKIPETDLKTQHQIFVNKFNFEKHLQFFKKKGFQTLTFNDLELFRTGQKNWKEFPHKPLILTFDDGYQDNLLNASPLLTQYGFRAQVFLLANAQIYQNQWDLDGKEKPHTIVAQQDRQQWLHSAFEIGSHGFNHKKISLMNSEEAYLELLESKKSLEKEFNQPINTYAYTYGDSTAKARELALLAGYSYAVSTDTGGLHLEEDPYFIFRVNMFPNESWWSLFKKTSTWYRRYYFYKRQK